MRVTLSGTITTRYRYRRRTAPVELSVNETFAALGLANWKPVVNAMLLPPAPFILMVLLAWMLRRRARRLTMGLMLTALAALWLSHCEGLATLLERGLASPPPLSAAQVSDLRRALIGRKPVVLVLGGGTRALAPEYGESHLMNGAAQRLHYGLWLARQVGVPVMVSGGAGHAQKNGPAEAAVAARIAARDYNVIVRWQEGASRDTRENARFSLLMLKPEGITDILLVTDGWHMPRALRAFQQEAERSGYRLRIVAASMGMGPGSQTAQWRWLPSVEGYRRVHETLHERFGLWLGA